MKRILLLTCLCVVASTSSFAQIIQSESKTTQTFYVENEPKTEKKFPCYQGEANIGYATVVNGFVETIHGWRFNKNLFVGGGIGFHYVDVEAALIPIFANLKAYIPTNQKADFFFNLSAGYDIGLNYPADFFCDLGLGVKLNKINIGLGWQRHGYDYHYYAQNYYVNQNSFYLKFGYCW